MLLTSTQVSVAVSSTIVFTFTSALFLSGYVLQQQTVRGLQAAIKPRLPTLTLATMPTDVPEFGSGRGSVWDDVEESVQIDYDFGGWDDDGEYDEDGNGGVTAMEISVNELKKRGTEDNVHPDSESTQNTEGETAAVDVELKKRELQDSIAEGIESVSPEDDPSPELKKRMVDEADEWLDR